MNSGHSTGKILSFFLFFFFFNVSNLTRFHLSFLLLLFCHAAAKAALAVTDGDISVQVFYEPSGPGPSV